MKTAPLLFLGFLVCAPLTLPRAHGLPIPEWICKYCSGGKHHPNPLLPERDDAAFARLREEIDQLNAAFYPIGTLTWCYTDPKHINKRLTALEERVGRLNVQVILRERHPRKIQRDLTRLQRDLHHLLCGGTRNLWHRAPRFTFQRESIQTDETFTFQPSPLK